MLSDTYRLYHITGSHAVSLPTVCVCVCVGVCVCVCVCVYFVFVSFWCVMVELS